MCQPFSFHTFIVGTNMTQKFSLILFALFFCLLFSQCNNSKTKQVSPSGDTTAPIEIDKSIPGSFSTQTKLVFDSTTLNRFLDSFPTFKKYEKEIDSFYIKRNYAYAWFDDKGMIEPANNLHNRMLNISNEGLPDKLPYQEAFTLLMEAEAGNTKPSPFTELMLTGQYLVYAKNVWEGLSEEESKSMDWLLPRKKTSTAALLDSLNSGRNLLEDAPVYRQYGLLKKQLEKYYQLQTQHKWETIEMKGSQLKRGDSSGVINRIRERLHLLGDLTTADSSNQFDADLEEAVKSFQRRYGFKETGVLTATTIREMNDPLEKRIQQIIVNMERSRWVPVKLSNNYLVVNIPEYKLHVYENDSVAWSMNVVVGKDQHKTVIFNGDLKYVVFSPYWNIPTSILRKEILPALKRNRNYLSRHNMEWHNGGVRQKPGPNNSLGLVKFLFPNSHNIYLHDSPAKSLFQETDRAFSHGCIRLAEPKKLAMYLLRNDSSWTEEKITAAMEGRVEKYVTLRQPVPVFISYFTAWVDKLGKVNFRKDIYKRDERLAQMIIEKPAI
jgi:murein L,D-transpeptidase YcbB/YkuD